MSLHHVFAGMILVGDTSGVSVVQETQDTEISEVQTETNHVHKVQTETNHAQEVHGERSCTNDTDRDATTGWKPSTLKSASTPITTSALVNATGSWKPPTLKPTLNPFNISPTGSDNDRPRSPTPLPRKMPTSVTMKKGIGKNKRPNQLNGSGVAEKRLIMSTTTNTPAVKLPTLNPARSTISTGSRTRN